MPAADESPSLAGSAHARSARPCGPTSLVRSTRPGLAMARSRRRRLGGAGQRGDAAADARRAGTCALRDMGGPLAHRRGLLAHYGGRCGAGLGPAGVPQAGAAVHCTERFGGRVPSDPARLRELPGVGEYTAAAVAAFATGARVAVVDTNVKRVHARAVTGVDDPRPVSAADRRSVAGLLPPLDAARWSVAVMELGATICTARSPGCAGCPVRAGCAWLGAGAPTWTGPAGRRQTYAGTDRQVRGCILALLRDTPTPVPGRAIDACGPEPAQRARALASLVSDGLAVRLDSGGYTLPSNGVTPTAPQAAHPGPSPASAPPGR